MTTKELLHQLVDELTEADAVQAVQALTLLRQRSHSGQTPRRDLSMFPFIGTLSAEPDFAARSEDMLREKLSRDGQ